MMKLVYTMYKLQLTTPAFPRERKQLDPTEIESTRGLTLVRFTDQVKYMDKCFVKYPVDDCNK